ncbi:isopentenyl-diphosphate Delta-isomerase [Marchantia polymorpha subsp. ruderalis]|uniref:isopentenyl-diphosphate Delta-isomerase n=2 Tax=Marchantia polymorpha TaxID=3197 RepID=A0A176VQY4_MARPO|nr:hypothetical protein AXG93_745s1210 [Marchantia polymorpha subsp. ruderalis]PTQ36127.1 hypothetical protein MARPO_0066s0080 [Marchantia polymorpha]BBN07057.1 hypothetical protein Mp_4g00610 [Marchantia polymorpha subsp. ruderalis]|eukprot:PTQ36127.1 hypothetical protein MARPO_0066s0080 [Marchantia polymorpha]
MATIAFETAASRVSASLMLKSGFSRCKSPFAVLLSSSSAGLTSSAPSSLSAAPAAASSVSGLRSVATGRSSPCLRPRHCSWGLKVSDPSSSSSEGGGGGRRRGLMSAAAMSMEVEQMDPVQQRLMFDDECILVDEQDNVVGHDSKYNCHLMEKIEKDNLLHRAFSVFLFNSKNELLLQKRSATKVTFPQVWTNTCCSHPLYRDSELIKENNLGVRNAAQRKLFDELGIEAKDAPVDDFTCLGRILYKAASDGKWGEHELDYLLFMKRDVAVKPNPDEVSDVQYVTKEQLQELVKKAKAGEGGVKLSPWFQLVVENFLYDWWKKLEEGTLVESADMKTIHRL